MSNPKDIIGIVKEIQARNDAWKPSIDPKVNDISFLAQALLIAVEALEKKPCRKCFRPNLPEPHASCCQALSCIHSLPISL